MNTKKPTRLKPRVCARPQSPNVPSTESDMICDPFIFMFHTGTEGVIRAMITVSYILFDSISFIVTAIFTHLMSQKHDNQMKALAQGRWTRAEASASQTARSLEERKYMSSLLKRGKGLGC